MDFRGDFPKESPNTTPPQAIREEVGWERVARTQRGAWTGAALEPDVFGGRCSGLGRGKRFPTTLQPNSWLGEQHPELEIWPLVAESNLSPSFAAV